MFDFRLKVFYTVAKRLNFTKAALELFISQPAVSKHIQEIEAYYKVKLFERNGSHITLTPAGAVLLKYTDDLFAIYQSMDYDMNAFSKRQLGKLKIGASTTIAQYVLSPILAAFHQFYPEVKIELSSGNSEQIEFALNQKEIDLGIIEGSSKKNTLKYTELQKDRIVLIASCLNSLSKKPEIKLDVLKSMPLLLREPGSGTLEVIAHALKPLNVKIEDLHVEMQLSSTESIKQYIKHSNCLAFLSMSSIINELDNHEFCIINVEGVEIERNFSFIQLQGAAGNLPELFMRFALRFVAKG